MRNTNLFRNVVAIGAILLLAIAGWSIAAAQDDNPRPFLGVTITSNEAGALIANVLPDSAAAEAGLQSGDIITAINGTEVTGETLAETVQGFAVGDEIALSVQRGQDNLELSATLAAAPDMSQMPGMQMMPMFDRPFLGIALEDGDTGVTIRQVAPDSPAAEVGLQVGDIITAINGETVSNAQAVADAVSALNIGDSVILDITRAGEAMSIEATLVNSPMGMGMLNNVNGIIYNGSNETWEIRGLSEDSPLYDAGLRSGDVVTQFDGQARDPLSLIEFVRRLDENAMVTLTVERDGATQEIDVPGEALKSFGMFGFGFNMPFNSGDFMGRPRLGIEFRELDETVAQEHNLDITEGALIMTVLPDSPAAEAGLEVNDVVTAVNGESVDVEHTLQDRLVAYEAGDTITLDVLRDGEAMTVDVTLGEVEGGIAPFGFGLDEMFPAPFEFHFQEPVGQQQPQANL